MLPLDSPEWSRLKHAYGAAADVPEMLRAVLERRERLDGLGAWTDLWSALAHQGDVYDASREAVVHLAAGLEDRSAEVANGFVHLIAWVEFCRADPRRPEPFEVHPEYDAALATAEAFVLRSLRNDLDRSQLRSALGLLALRRDDRPLAAVCLAADDSDVDGFVRELGY